MERGHDVALVVGRPVSDHAYEVVPNGGRYSQYLRAPLTHAWRFRDADVVLDVANGMSFFSPLWRRGPSAALVHHIHEGQWEQWFPRPAAAVGSFLERRAMPWTYRHTLFVTVSESTAASLVALGVSRDRIRIVANGIELPAAVGGESVDPIFLSLARLVPHKRVPLAVEAWQQVQQHVEGTLVIVGGGPEEETVRKMGVERVRLLGKVSEADKQRLLAQCRLLVHPSMLEGWGLVVMEAAAHGKPTLAFDVQGIRDSVVHGTTGVLANGIDDFVQQWISLATDDARRHRLGAAARDRAALFPWARTVKEFEEVLLEVRSMGASGAFRRSAAVRPAPLSAPAPAKGVADDVPTAWELLKLFRAEKHDPGPFTSASPSAQWPNSRFQSRVDDCWIWAVAMASTPVSSSHGVQVSRPSTWMTG